jgi:hypothetical protein
LTGAPPFVGGGVTDMRQHAGSGSTAVSAPGARHSPALDRVVLRALRSAPGAVRRCRRVCLGLARSRARGLATRAGRRTDRAARISTTQPHLPLALPAGPRL